MDNYEKLMSHPAVECCHPKFIAVVDGKKDFVAEVVDGVVYLTDAGKKLLAEEEAKPSKKTRKAVESANPLADDLGELNLNE